MRTLMDVTECVIMAIGAHVGPRISALLLAPRHDLQIGLGGFGNRFRMSGIDGGEIHQVAAHAQGPRAGARESSPRFAA